MCEQVNINVQETNETVNIVATEVQEVIDINVYETTEDVTLNITEQLIQVNINKVTSGIQNLQGVTNEGNTTTNSMVVDSTYYQSIIDNSYVVSENKSTGSYVYIGGDGVVGISNGNVESDLKNTNVTQNVTLEFPAKTSGTYTIATTEDIPSAQVNSDWNATSGVAEILNKPTIPAAVTNTSDLVNDGEDGINPFITALDIPNYTSVVKHIVKNNGSALITKGTAVYVTSSNGTNMLVGRASNTSEATSSKTMGLMQSDITTTGANQTGFVITEGLLEGLNTASTTAGDPVWLGVNGELIYGLANKPYAPAHLVFIGIVTKVSAGNGEIFVKVQNGFELKEIHDVDLITTTPINGHLLGFDGTLWVNKTIASWLGFTPVTNARTISTTAPLSGGGDLSANRTLSISQATTSTDGFLSSTDWNTFNNKQGELFDFYSKKGFIFWEDFLGDSLNSTTEGWGVSTRVTAGTATITSNNTFPNRTYQQGVVAISTNLNLASQGVIRVGAFNNAAGQFFGNGKVIFETYVNVETLSTAADRFLVHIGYSASIAVNTNACYQFVYDEGGTSTNGGTASPNWKCCTFNNVTRTNTNTGIAVTASAWYKLRIEVNATNTGVDFYINNSLVASHTTGVGGAITGLSPKIVMTKTAGLNNRNLYVDYIGINQTFTNQR